MNENWVLSIVFRRSRFAQLASRFDGRQLCDRRGNLVEHRTDSGRNFRCNFSVGTNRLPSSAYRPTSSTLGAPWSVPQTDQGCRTSSVKLVRQRRRRSTVARQCRAIEVRRSRVRRSRATTTTTHHFHPDTCTVCKRGSGLMWSRGRIRVHRCGHLQVLFR